MTDRPGPSPAFLGILLDDGFSPGDSVSNTHPDQRHAISDAQLTALVMALRDGRAAKNGGSSTLHLGSWLAGLEAGLQLSGGCASAPHQSGASPAPSASSTPGPTLPHDTSPVSSGDPSSVSPDHAVINIVEAFGGLSKAARAFDGCPVSTVGSWVANGRIPAWRRAQVEAAAAAAGIALPVGSDAAFRPSAPITATPAQPAGAVV